MPHTECGAEKHLKPNCEVLVVQSAEVTHVPHITSIDLAAGGTFAGQPGDPNEEEYNKDIIKQLKTTQDYLHLIHFFLGTLHFAHDCALFAVLHPASNSRLGAAIAGVFREIQACRLTNQRYIFYIV